MHHNNLKPNQVVVSGTNTKTHFKTPTQWRIEAILNDGRILAKSLTGNIQRVFDRNYAFTMK